MKKLIVKIFRSLFYIAFLFIFTWVSAQLFFEKETENFLVSAKEVVFPSGDLDLEKLKDLRVVYPADPLSLEPTLADPIARQRLDNIYETLVKFDRDLNIKPALALSWGMLDDYTWEFKLRPKVKFHDGSDLDLLDVLTSYDRAMNYEKSELIGVLSTVDIIKAIDEDVFIIKTFDPDPLLLQRLTTVRIFPDEFKDYDVIPSVGTASYKFVSWGNDSFMELSRFDDYWGKESKFENVKIYSSVDKNERVRMFIEDEVDLLVFVPFDAAQFLEENDFQMSQIPSLEVQFLTFNFESKYFKDLDNRKAFSFALNQNDLIDMVGGFARRVNQFVSNGVFGYSPVIADHEYNTKLAKKIVKETEFEGKTIQFHLPIGLDVLGDFVRESLAEIGVNVVVSNLEINDLLKSMEKGTADLYFFGFKSELADSSDFLNLLAKTEGVYNYSRYSNDEVDRLINSSLTNIDERKRIIDLQKAMKIIVEDDFLGVPLFEYETIFAFNDKLGLEPRIDGLIYFDDLILK